VTQLGCPFLADYCDITNDKSFFADADAVVYHMRDDINLKEARKYRNPAQRFVFALWESPKHTPDLNRYKGFFNWTMTYRFQSHIVSSYYSGNAYIHTSSDYYQFLIKENEKKKRNSQFIIRDHQLSDEILANKKLGTVAAIISNCGGSSARMFWIKQLKRYIDIKVYGRCGETCPTNMNCREFVAKNYFFFLSFENSLCKDYTSNDKDFM
jgi:alpha-1,3-fucosyltransferase